jgi:hypothetical protein
MALGAGFIKYFYVFILFIVTFIASRNSVTEATAYGFMSGVQGILALIFTFELMRDSARGYKAMKIHTPKTYYTDESTIQLPLYWVLFPAIVTQFIASIITAIYTNFLQKKYGYVKLERANQLAFNWYKWGIVIVTIAIAGLLYSYTSDFTGTAVVSQFSSAYTSWLLILVFTTIVFSIMNMKNANHISRIMVSTTE